MASVLDGACSPALTMTGKNSSSGGGTSSPTCNQSMLKLAPYSPEATAVFATAITLMVLFTIVGNILVIIAVLTSRSLRGPQNLFLVSLAAADILVATLIIPFSLANELMGYWYFRTVWCEIYLALDVLFCTSSIVHLCAISLDRYLSISRAVTYGAQRTPQRIKAAILVVWLISAVISFPPLLSMNKKGNAEGEGRGPQCELNGESWYILYSTIGSFFAPCLIMILVYMRIYQIAKQRTRCPPGEPRKDGGAKGSSAAPTPQLKTHGQHQPNGRGSGDAGTPVVPHKLVANATPRPHHLAVPPHTPSPRVGKRQQQEAGTPSGNNLLQAPSPSPAQTPTTPSTPLGPTPANSPSISSTDQQQQQLPDNSTTAPAKPGKEPAAPPPPRANEKKSSKRQDKRADNNNGDTSSSDSDTDQGGPGSGGSGGRDDDGCGADPTPSMAGTPSPGIHSPATIQKYRDMIATAKGAKLVTRRSKQEGTPNSARRKAMVNREKRFTFVLAVVIGVFVVCWFPFFFTYSLSAICPDTCRIPDPLFKFFFWIGYCNSCLNPVIYTIFNKDFRRAFKKILCKNTKGTFF